jgi:hypothetical protein
MSDGSRKDFIAWAERTEEIETVSAALKRVVSGWTTKKERCRR